MNATVQTQSAQHAFTPRSFATCTGAMVNEAYALVRAWWHRYRSRLELASYSHDQLKDFGFSADVDGEIAKPFWKS
jgi:uncharacterized protein YjiS (DUF1127 family)